MNKVHLTLESAKPGIMKREAYFVHDCSKCVLVGQRLGEDMYVCEKEKFIEVIMRYGNNGPDYWSTTYFKVKE